MERNTSLTHSIEVADSNAQYDANAKKILANKEVLARILKGTTKELSEDRTKILTRT